MAFNLVTGKPIRTRQRGGSPASRLVMSMVKTSESKCNEPFLNSSSTHDVSGGDFYMTTGGSRKKRRGKRVGKNTYRKGNRKRSKSQKKKKKSVRKGGGAHERTPPVFV